MMNKQLMKSKVTGFTLIELMVVVAIVGVLAAIAIPSYQETRLRTNRTDAKAALMQEAATQESIFSTSLPAGYTTVSAYITPDGKYSITVASCGTGTINNCFVATAAPVGAQTNDECGSLTITNTGVRGSSSGVATTCWQR